MRNNAGVARIVAFVLVLIMGLGGLTFAASYVVERTVAEWSRRDLNLRAQVVARAARESLLAHWEDNPQRLEELLEDLTEDERMYAAAACSDGLAMLAETTAFSQQPHLRSPLA